MTLIAGFVRYDCPILLGDLLVSDQDESEKEFVFPTVGKITKRDLLKGGYSPSHLCQKVVLISPMLAICWANTKIHAKSFVKSVIDANGHSNPSRELLSDIYKDIGGQDNLSIIALYRNGVEMSVLDFESWPVDSPYSGFSYFKAAGSGYGSLLDLIPEIHQRVVSGNPNRLEKGIATAIQLGASFLSQEILSQHRCMSCLALGTKLRIH
jgi:hypothetical protein